MIMGYLCNNPVILKNTPGELEALPTEASSNGLWYKGRNPLQLSAEGETTNAPKNLTIEHVDLIIDLVS